MYCYYYINGNISLCKTVIKEDLILSIEFILWYKTIYRILKIPIQTYGS